MTAQQVATKSSTEAYYARLESELLPLRTALVNHAVYRRIGDATALRVFMSNHAFAVWDFMSLLKALQRRLTCIEVPWLPPADTTAARLINEIVLGEETDEVTPGRYASHYDLYLEAMLEVGADSRPIRGFVSSLRDGTSPEKTLAAITLPDSTRQFVLETLRTCSRPVIQVAASFLLGREDLVPSMFRPILASLEAAGTRCETFRLYLERHVHLDEEQHGPMARRLLASLCGTDEANWRIATDAAAQALKSRCALWDGVLAAIG